MRKKRKKASLGKKKNSKKGRGKRSLLQPQHKHNKGPKSRKDFLDLRFSFFLAIIIIPYNNSLRAQTLSLSLSLSLSYPFLLKK
jgi:hypothetical protein